MEPWIETACTINSAISRLYLELDLHTVNFNDIKDISIFYLII